jgi:transcriptional regulator GlxA family with amidase domain
MICHQLAIPRSEPGAGEGDLVTRCLSFMEQHLDEAISLETLVDLTGVSKTQLLDRFRRDHGLSPIKALTSMRMDHARGLLTQTDMTISQIANSAGYAELTAFTRAFTRQAGKSPSAYRRDAQWLV